MFVILLHSSKTTNNPSRYASHAKNLQTPVLLSFSEKLASYLKSLARTQIKDSMNISDDMAIKTLELVQKWDTSNPTLPALDIFLGDIYSGLQAQTFSEQDRQYANKHLFILSGLYGVLRALDKVQPYRLEMGYKLPGNVHDPSQPNFISLYDFWGDKIARQLPINQPIINLSAKEYTKAVFPHFKNIDGLKDVQIITPKFLTLSPKTNEPTFVTVHAKIARGAYARWLIQNRIEDINKLKEFNDLGYEYNEVLSKSEEPVFVAKEFKGLGLSIRLTK